MWRKLEPEEIAFNEQINAVFLNKALSFEDAAREYRRIEEECVERDDERKAIETRRRITEWILKHAFYTDQPHEVCQAIWEELVQRGFSDQEVRCNFTALYARCCQFNATFDAGIAVLEPLIAGIRQALDGNSLTPKERFWYEKDIVSLGRILDQLKSGIRDPPPKFLNKTKAQIYEEAARACQEFDEEPDERDDESKAVEKRRSMTEWLLMNVRMTGISDEICQELWDELVQGGFADLGEKGAHTHTYAQCCQFYGRFDDGIAVLEPLIAEMKQALDGNTLTPEMRSWYEHSIVTCCKLLDELKAGIQESD